MSIFFIRVPRRDAHFMPPPQMAIFELKTVSDQEIP